MALCPAGSRLIHHFSKRLPKVTSDFTSRIYIYVTAHCMSDMSTLIQSKNGVCSNQKTSTRIYAEKYVTPGHLQYGVKRSYMFGKRCQIRKVIGNILNILSER
jgi:hypothetical protein